MNLKATPGSAAASASTVPDSAVRELLDTDEPLYVFGYGSLMWMPDFEPASAMPARAIGWHRRFSLLSLSSWGTEDTPGLCAALHPGGSAWGRALEIPRLGRTAVLAGLVAREAAYVQRCIRIDVRGTTGTARRRALTFVSDSSHPRTVSDLDRREAGRLVRQGRGVKGTSLDYLRRTVDALETDGHSDSDAHRFLAMIDGKHV